MPAEKNYVLRQDFFGSGANCNLGTAGVGHQRPRFRRLPHLRQQLEDGPNRRGEIDEIRVGDRLRQINHAPVNRAALLRALERSLPTPADNLARKARLLERERKRAPDQSTTQNRDSLERHSWIVGLVNRLTS